jgi:hypothetical protein
VAKPYDHAAIGTNPPRVTLELPTREIANANHLSASPAERFSPLRTPADSYDYRTIGIRSDGYVVPVIDRPIPDVA